jgi:hypothetical protein
MRTIVYFNLSNILYLYKLKMKISQTEEDNLELSNSLGD